MSDNDFIKQAYEKIQPNLSDKAKLGETSVSFELLRPRTLGCT